MDKGAKGVNNPVSFFLQLIFRKVSDVLKEQELAEKRKNDPVLNHTQDHLVRKLFNKFKKGPDVGSAGSGGSASLAGLVGGSTGSNAADSNKITLVSPSPNSRDVEKGEVPKTEVTPPTDNLPASLEVSASPAANNTVAPAPVKSTGLKGWGRLRGGGGGGSPAPAAPAAEKPTPPKVEAPPAEKVKEPSPKAESKPALLVQSSPKVILGKKESKESTAAAAAVAAAASQEYQAITDRLNRIEQLISDLMVKVDDKTRSIEKSVAKVKLASSSKSKKPHQVTICVDSSGAQQGASGSSNQPTTSTTNCDEQFL